MASINLYTIAVPDNELEKLAQKLSAASLLDELDDANWDYGAPLADITLLTQHWKDGFDWRREESKINNLSNFMTAIEVEGFGSLDIHFVHQKRNVEKAIPLLFSHGCMLPYFPLTCLSFIRRRAWKFSRGLQAIYFHYSAVVVKYPLSTL